MLATVAQGEISTLLSSRRVVVCVGAGGVGKTSIAAALSVAAARTGRRVVVLTVDPAKRLAEALGVAPDGDARPMSREACDTLGIGEGLLAVKVLDASRVWDATVRNLSTSEEAAQRILQHSLYQTLRLHLAGAQDYMAMEALLTLLKEEPPESLIVLDTPPSRHALDFLRGPERLSGALNTPFVRSIARSTGRTGRLGLDWAARGAAALVAAMGRLTGQGFLEELATLIAALHQLFGGLEERAQRVGQAFRDPSFAFLLVTRPNRAAIDDTVFFLGALAEQGMRAAGVLVNRCRLAEGELPAATPAIAEQLATLVEPSLASRVGEAVAHEREQRTYEERCVAQLQAHSFGGPTFLVPPVATGVGELASLARLSSLLTDGTPALA